MLIDLSFWVVKKFCILYILYTLSVYPLSLNNIENNIDRQATSSALVHIFIAGVFVPLPGHSIPMRCYLTSMVSVLLSSNRVSRLSGSTAPNCPPNFKGTLHRAAFCDYIFLMAILKGNDRSQEEHKISSKEMSGAFSCFTTGERPSNDL